MRNDPCLKKTRIKSRSGGIAQVRLSDALVGMLLRLIGQTLHLYAKHLHAAGVNALLYCGQSLVHGCLRAQSEVEEGDRLYNGLLAYLGSELLTQV
ncbi:hypothetical protein ACVWZP_003682 [Pseudomonas sp. TE36184]